MNSNELPDPQLTKTNNFQSNIYESGKKVNQFGSFIQHPQPNLNGGDMESIGMGNTPSHRQEIEVITNREQEKNRRKSLSLSVVNEVKKEDTNIIPESQQTPSHKKLSIIGGVAVEKEEDVDIFAGEDEDDQKSPCPLFANILENNIFQVFITLLTVYALFGDDIRVISTDKTYDIGFDIVTIICLIMFSIEIFLACLAKVGYVCSFFFWLDFISTISLIMDIQMVSALIFYGSGGSSQNTAQIAQAGKASRVGTKAGRVVRLVRLIRIVKLYKAAQDADKANQENLQKLKEIREQRNKKKQSQKLGAADVNAGQSKAQEQPQEQAQDGSPTKIFKESRLSKKVSDLTTKKVIIIVLLLLFLMPLFSADYFFDSPTSIDYVIKHLQVMSEKKVTSQQNITNIMKTIQWTHTDDRVLTPLIFLQAPFSFTDTFQLPINDLLREDEKEIGSYDVNHTLYIVNHPDQISEAIHLNILAAQKDGGLTILGVINKSKLNVASAGLSLGRTIFVCIVLTTGALMFSKDATDLALNPIEKMIQNVNRIARNPILAKELKLNKEDGSQMETVIIDNAIIKIGTLLALGFGDAGSEIIGTNMARGGDVDPMIGGKKISAIFGFVDIRNFTDATEQLQEDVMLFVNNIGEVVHGMVDRYAGAANKNIGDAFLLVWKMRDGSYSLNEETNHIELLDKKYISVLADFALIAFMKVQAKLNREKKVLAYRLEQRLLVRMGADYKVKMGCGLHYGWAIEGAIGSEFKIDASYLSPNVNMSGKLESSTKQFGVPLLISHNLHALFTPKLQRYTRLIDRVAVRATGIVTGYYAIDMNVDCLPPSKDPEGYDPAEKKELDKMKKMDIMAYLNDMANNNWDAEDYIQSNKDLRLMMESFSDEFYAKFNEGCAAYVKGDWQLAKKIFDEGELIRPNDGPVLNLRDIMGEHGYKAPHGWPGYRYEGGGAH